MQAATDLAKVSVKGDAQTIALLEAQLTSDSKTDVRLAAVSAIGQVAETNDPEAIESCRPASAIEVGPSHRQPPGSSWKGLVKGTSPEMLSPVFLCWPLSPVQAAIDLAKVSVKRRRRPSRCWKPSSPATARQMSVWPQ